MSILIDYARKALKKGLGSNKTAKGVIRASKALGMIAPILRQFDSDNNISVASSSHSMASADRDRDRDIIVNELKFWNFVKGVAYLVYQNPILYFISIQKKNG